MILPSLPPPLNLIILIISGIAHCGVGPIVFYKGFTRAYLRKETLSDDILKQKAVDAVKLIG